MAGAGLKRLFEMGWQNHWLSCQSIRPSSHLAPWIDRSGGGCLHHRTRAGSARIFGAARHQHPILRPE